MLVFLHCQTGSHPNPISHLNITIRTLYTIQFRHREENLKALFEIRAIGCCILQRLMLIEAAGHILTIDD
jgi:hypothetical protein